MTTTNNHDDGDVFSEFLPIVSLKFSNLSDCNEENTTQQDDFSTSHSIEISDDINVKVHEGESNHSHDFLVTPPTSISSELAQILLAADLDLLPSAVPNETTQYITDANEAAIDDTENDATESEISDAFNSEHFVRRSTRDPTLSLLERNDIKMLIEKIRSNQQDTVILKVKDHIIADINSAVIEAIILALSKNKVCQALYVQNLSKSIGDSQIKGLISLLRKRKIWCLNIGETYEVSNEGWQYFCDMLPETFVTHLYVSEHVISAELKTLMRSHIRENRKKHLKHCSPANIKVIEKCTNMWWNPINGIKNANNATRAAEVIKPAEVEYSPADTKYWQEGLGKGGDIAWRFSCVCKETCSSYENYRYHPQGRMFECSVCTVWSHTDCVLGTKVKDEDIDGKFVMCKSCEVKSRRASKFGLVYTPPVYTSTDDISENNLHSSNSTQKRKKKTSLVEDSVANSSTRSSRRKKENVDELL
mmetsp:Transcript_10598/g.15937  ORF Transcript_10598/g.15937 Transcript_10598/m.15937 type:complete len:477 (+) Transcript_10598:42-1472(+)